MENYLPKFLQKHLPVTVTKSNELSTGITEKVHNTASDELHQLFVLGRGGQVEDVVLDGFGALVGIGVYYGRKIFH